jgi:hypothetical protein
MSMLHFECGFHLFEGLERSRPFAVYSIFTLIISEQLYAQLYLITSYIIRVNLLDMQSFALALIT